MNRSKHSGMLAIAAAVAIATLLGGCGDDAPGQERQTGTSPELPEPRRGLLPSMTIADPVGWGDQVPTVPAGYTISAIATTPSTSATVLLSSTVARVEPSAIVTMRSNAFHLETVRLPVSRSQATSATYASTPTTSTRPSRGVEPARRVACARWTRRRSTAACHRRRTHVPVRNRAPRPRLAAQRRREREPAAFEQNAIVVIGGGGLHLDARLAAEIDANMIETLVAPERLVGQQLRSDPGEHRILGNCTGQPNAARAGAPVLRRGAPVVQCAGSSHMSSIGASAVGRL